MSVVIVGAGIAGLCCALELARAGREVLVLEREAEPGGRVRSRVVDGYTVDRGFQVLFTAYPTLAVALGLRPGATAADDDAGLALRRFRPAARVVTARGASLVGDALRDPSLLGATIAAGALPVADKLRVLALRRFATGLTVDECFAPRWDAMSARQFLAERGFSDAAVRRFFAPFYGGILLDRSLSTSAAILLFTFKMLAEGDTVVPARGMGALARRLAARVAATPHGAVRCGTGVARVVVEGGRARGVVTEAGETLAADDVVLAVDPPALAHLAATAGARLPAPDTALGCTTLWLASRAPYLPGAAIWLDGRDADGAPADARSVVSHAVTMTEVAPEYAAPDAPHGAHLLAATAVGPAATLDDARLERQARADLAALRAAARLPGAAPTLVTVAVERVPYAQFGQAPGARARRTPATAGVPGLWRASETAHSSSLEGAARGGLLAAGAILAQGAQRDAA